MSTRFESTELHPSGRAELGASLEILPSDRVLVLAPHPDDESLATGGLLQRAAAVGAAARIALLTDGDRNPWAQLVHDRRWPVSSSDRERWGRHRRTEARAALEALGVTMAQVEFFGFPDQELTDLLLEPGRRLEAALRSLFREWSPTLVLSPSITDRHPDHSATAVAALLALGEPADRGLPEPRLLHYHVHPARNLSRETITLRLDPLARGRKLLGISCHTSQLWWRRRQLFAHAREEERFEGPLPASAWIEHHPIRLAFVEGEALHLECARPALAGGGALLRILCVTRHGSRLQGTVRLPLRSGEAALREEGTGEWLGSVSVRGSGRIRRLTLAPPGVIAWTACYLKLEWPAERRLGLFDRAGWRAVALPQPGAARARALDAATAISRPPLERPLAASRERARPPRVSVVVPARNEEVLLPACLDSLLRQDYPGEVEILVVDNASIDATAEVAHRRGVRVLSESSPGYCLSLRRGFAEASGGIVACTDADTRVPRDWISRLVREYEMRPDVVAVGGAIHFTGASWKARLLTRGLLPIIDFVDRRNRRGPHLWGANLSVRREAFVAAGGWNTDFELQADSELSVRMRAQGRVVLLEDLVVSSSSRRWNHALGSSLFLYGANFASLAFFHRPLFRRFPDVRDPVRRDGEPPAPRGRRARKLAGALAGLVLLAMGTTAYVALVPESNAFGPTYWHAVTRHKLVALTFDDGPNEPYTSEVLGILRREHVKATFFLIGNNIRRFPRTALEIARAGHAIGNHSDSHPDGLALETTAAQSRELDRAEETIHAATGLYPHLFRPPHGLRSPWLISTLTRDSLLAVTWDDAPGDWNPMTPEQIVRVTLAQAHPGSIVLLHDGMNLQHGADQSETVKALPGIVRGLKRLGYQFVTVPDLLHQPAYLRSWRAP